MKIIIEPEKNGDCLTTIAIGEPYYQAWERYALPGWEQYCRKHRLGLIAFDEDLVSRENIHWKKATWQKMFIGHVLDSTSLTVRNICYLDTDILINYHAPNIFESYEDTKIGLVSLRKRLPYPYNEVIRRLAFLRHEYYDKKYPLDSALFMSLDQLYGYHHLAVQQDEACMGLILFNVKNHKDIMLDWFNKYDRNVQSVTDGGDQTHTNYEIQNWGNVQWMDYRFQALWVFEMAWKYPFLYKYERNNQELIRQCIEASLFTNYFLHFAGSWHESGMWKLGNIISQVPQNQMFDHFYTYMETPVTGEPKGIIKPKN